ncbi:MAG: hypothetical protein K0Q72_3418 [Armatimonadetes bacterium]|jgi:hypothetical protein|nr:hypothetical protein [Armatimonadota bacterium]
MDHGRINRRLLLGGALAAGTSLWLTEARAQDGVGVFTGDTDVDRVLITNPAGKPVLRYLRQPIEGEPAPSVEGACYTHPIYTPAGEIVTDLAPKDHPHHRGVFCAWVAVDGERDGDWWGWGAKAPKEGRHLLSREARMTEEAEERGTLRAINSWRAEEERVLGERVTITVSAAPSCHVIDYDFKYTVGGRKPAVIAQNPFGGFCYRALPRGEVLLTGPDGVLNLPNSVFDQADTNWPASKWYDLTYTTPDGKVNGVTVMDHPNNPQSTWHVVRNLHMLNPCIVAQGPHTIEFGEPLYLRYRLVAHDGHMTSIEADRLYEEFANRD